jgi:hypothetical protein
MFGVDGVEVVYGRTEAGKLDGGTGMDQCNGGLLLGATGPQLARLGQLSRDAPGSDMLQITTDRELQQRRFLKMVE